MESPRLRITPLNASSMPSPMPATASAWSSRASGSPATAMYASPIVLIFSTPYAFAKWSNAEKMSSSRSTSWLASTRSEKVVKPHRSANKTLTDEKDSAIVETLFFNRSAIVSGRILRSRRSDFSRSRVKSASDRSSAPKAASRSRSLL